MSHGPVKSPPVENATISSEMADLMGCTLRVGDVVFYRYQPGSEPWAAIIVAMKENEHLDLVCFRPDGNTVRYWEVPKANPKRMGDYWEARP